MGNQDEIKSKLKNEYIKDTSKSGVEPILYEHPSVWKDVIPYFQPLAILYFYLVVYQITGSVALGAWLMYVLTPLYNLVFLDDNRNITPKNEKAFLQSKLFLLPLWGYVFGYLAAHIYGLMIFSTKWRPNLPIFEVVPETNL